MVRTPLRLTLTHDAWVRRRLEAACRAAEAAASGADAAVLWARLRDLAAAAGERELAIAAAERLGAAHPETALVVPSVAPSKSPLTFREENAVTPVVAPVEARGAGEVVKPKATEPLVSTTSGPPTAPSTEGVVRGGALALRVRSSVRTPLARAAWLEAVLGEVGISFSREDGAFLVPASKAATPLARLAAHPELEVIPA